MAPFLSVTFKIVSKRCYGDGSSCDNAAKRVLACMASPNVILILGGFTIAIALNKHRLDRRLAVWVLAHAGHSFKLFLAVLMILGAFMSMWISNVVAPALMAFIVQPILLNVDKQTGKCVALAIAFSCNVGGMLTPIASPQNDVAVERLNDYDQGVGFGGWILISLPICIIFLFIIWIFLLVWFKPSQTSLNTEGLIQESRPLFWEDYLIIFTVILTVILWCTYKSMENFWGSLGIIALLPIVILFGVGILDKQDLSK